MGEKMERIAGAILGALIGDALATGCHWYYDIPTMRRVCGAWVSDYRRPAPGHYHDGLEAGECSQSGLLLVLLMESLLARSGYEEEDFTRRLDEEFFPQLDGSPRQGPGGYTSQSIREAWRKRVVEGRPWGQCAGYADTTEGVERVIPLVALLHGDLAKMAEAVLAHVALTQKDVTVLAMSLAYASVLALLLRGETFDSRISHRLMAAVQSGALPFHTVTGGDLAALPVDERPLRPGEMPSPDALLTPGNIAAAACDPAVVIEPAWKASLVYGMPCAIYHQLPAVYYLTARFPGDYEGALLHAVNGGGQNLSRAMLTGALMGAQVGLSGIPERFLRGLREGERYLDMARRLAMLA
ncbi:MAG: ADP-ribosylglycohydrolase family protein [Acidithiobacillus sp.]|uniref:ADP-ribosylglycohydrolase family protein n=1 Tax=Acidithiobacillus sp. TaxID=1872118 RepID=UPI003D04BEF2